MSIPGPPEGLEWVTFVLVGENWPEGDEDGMRALAEVWLRLGEDLAPLEGQLRSVVAQLEAAGQGPALAAAQEFLLRISGGADAALPKLRKAIDDVVGGAEKVALEIEYTKLMIIGFAVILLHMLMKLLFLSVMSGGAASAAAAPIVETFRQVVLRLLKRLALSVVQGALFMVALDVAVQGFQVVVLKTRDLKEWDLQKTGFMAGIGALGGGINWSLGWMRRLPFGKSWLGTVVKNSLAEGLPELIADTIAQGNADVGPRGGFVGGLLSGAVEGAIEHPMKGMSRRRIFTDNSLLYLLGRLFGADVTLGPPPDVLNDLPKDQAAGGGGAGPVGVPGLSPDEAADVDPVPTYHKEIPAGELSLGGGPGRNPDVNPGSSPSPSPGSGSGSNSGSGSGGVGFTAGGPGSAVESSDVGRVVGSSVDGGSVGGSQSGVLVDAGSGNSLNSGGGGAADGGGAPSGFGSVDGSPLSAELGVGDFSGLMGADGGVERERLFDEWRGAELGWFEKILGESSPQGGELLGLSVADVRAEWMRQVETHFENVFAPLVAPVDPVSGASLVPMSVDQVRGMVGRWREFADDMRVVAELGGASWVGVLFAHVFTGHDVEVVVDRWLGARPDVVVSAVDRIALRDAVVAGVRGEVSARLEAVAESGALPTDRVVKAVKSVRGDGVGLERRVEERLAALVAAGRVASQDDALNAMAGSTVTLSADPVGLVDTTAGADVVVPLDALVSVASDGGTSAAGPVAVTAATASVDPVAVPALASVPVTPVAVSSPATGGVWTRWAAPAIGDGSSLTASGVEESQNEAESRPPVVPPIPSETRTFVEEVFDELDELVPSESPTTEMVAGAGPVTVPGIAVTQTDGGGTPDLVSPDLGPVAGAVQPSGPPSPDPRLTSSYNVRSVDGGMWFESLLPLAVAEREPTDPTAFPAFVPQWSSVVQAHPPLRVSADFSLAINGTRSVQSSTDSMEVREFFASGEVLATAQAALRRTGGDIELEVSGVQVLLDESGAETALYRVVPRMREPRSDVCRDFAGKIHGEVADTVIFRQHDGTTALADINAQDGTEVTGMWHLAEGLTDFVEAGQDPAEATAAWATSLVAQDVREMGGGLGQPMPGDRYGAALSYRPGNEPTRQGMDDLASRIGINQHAWAAPGETYASVSVPTQGPDGKPDFSRDVARGVTNIGGSGYHFAAVIAESADGRSQITLENATHQAKILSVVEEAIRRNLANHGADPESALHNLDARLLDLNPPPGDPAQGPVAAEAIDLRNRRALAEALAALQPTGYDGAPAELQRNARRTMLAAAALPSPGDQWYFRMYTREPGESFFEQQALFYEPSAPVPSVNPLVVVTTGGHRRIGSVTVHFERGERKATGQTPGGLRWAGRRVARSALWCADNGLPLPTVVVTGHANVGLRGETRARRAAAERADSTVTAFRAELDSALARLQGADVTIRADQVQMYVTAADPHTDPGTASDNRRVTLEFFVRDEAPSIGVRPDVGTTARSASLPPGTSSTVLPDRTVDPAPAAETPASHERARRPVRSWSTPAWFKWDASSGGDPASTGSGPAASRGTPVLVSDTGGRAVYGWVPDGRTIPLVLYRTDGGSSEVPAELRAWAAETDRSGPGLTLLAQSGLSAEALLEAVEWAMARLGDAAPASVELVTAQGAAGLSDRQLAELWQKYPETDFTQSSRATPRTELLTDRGSTPTPVAPEGNDLFDALIGAFPKHLSSKLGVQKPTVEMLRERVAATLEADFALADGAAQWAGFVAQGDGETPEAARQRYVTDIRTPGSWQHDADDLVPTIAAAALGLPATLLITPVPGGSTAVASVGVAAGRYLPAAGGHASPAASGGSLPVYESAGVEWFAVVAHGKPGGVQVGDRVLDAAGFAGWVRSVPGWAGRPLALVVCGAAKADANGGSFAQEVRDLLGVRVLAAPENVYTSESGAVFAGSFDLAPGRPRFTSAGEAAWQLFPAERDAASKSLRSGSLDMAMYRVGATVRAEGEHAQRQVAPAAGPTWSGWAGGPGTAVVSPDPVEVLEVTEQIVEGRPVAVQVALAGGGPAPALDGQVSGSYLDADLLSALDDTLIAVVDDRVVLRPDGQVNAQRFVESLELVMQPIAASPPDAVVVALNGASTRFPEQLRQVADVHPDVWFLAAPGPVYAADGLLHAGAPGRPDTWLSFRAGKPVEDAVTGALTRDALSDWLEEATFDLPTAIAELRRQITVLERSLGSQPATGGPGPAVQDEVRTSLASATASLRDAELSGSTREGLPHLFGAHEHVLRADRTRYASGPALQAPAGPVRTGEEPAPESAVPTDSTAPPSDAELLDAAFVVAMQPVLEMRLRQARGLTSRDAPEVREVADALRQFNLLIEEARQAGELPSAPLARILVNAPPAQMRAWQETAQRSAAALAQRAADTDEPETRARRLLGSVLYRDFPMRTSALGLDPEAPGNTQFLPLVQHALDPSALAVNEEHMDRLTGYVMSLVEANEPVTLDALTRRAGFAALRIRLDDRTEDSLTELDQRIAGWQHDPPLSPDRMLELRGLARDLSVEGNESFVPSDRNLETLNQVIESAYRRYAKVYDGARPDGPLRLAHLEDLLRHKLGDRATLTWANVRRVAAESDARQHWRERHPGQAWMAGVTRSVTVKLPALGRSAVYQAVSARHTRNIQRVPGQADSPAERQAELNGLWTEVSAAPTAPPPAASLPDPDLLPGDAVAPATRQPDPVTQDDLAELVDVRRLLYADPRDRRYTGLSDYRPMALELLGVEGPVGAAEVRELASLVRDARAASPPRTGIDAAVAAVRFHRAVTRRQLTELAISRWQDGKPGGRPSPEGVAQDHSRMVTAFHAIEELPFVPELTAWINRAVPFGGGQISEEVVNRTLASLFGQVLDDGAALSATAEGRTYDLRLWAVAAGEPVVEPASLLGAKEADSTRFSGKQENRIYRYRDTAIWRSEAQGSSLDVGVAYRGGFGAPGTVSAGRADVAATYGRVNTRGRRQLAANASSDFQQLRIKEPLGWVHLPVNWVLRVQDRATGRWRELSLRDVQGTLREHRVRYAVAQFQLPYSLPESQLPGLSSNIDPDYRKPTTITSAEQFPVWNLDHAVPRVQLADSVLDGVRQALDPQDYAFWKPVVEAYLSNDQLALGLRDILRPARGPSPTDRTDDRHYQQVFRHTLQRDGRHLSLSLTAGGLAQPVRAVTKISEVSRSGETRFDRVLAVVNKTLLSQDATRSGRGTLTGSLRAIEQYLRVGGRGQFTQRSGDQLIRHHRAMLTRAMRVGGPLQVVLADFTVQLEVHHRHGAVVTAPAPVNIDGFAHLMMHSDALRSLSDDTAAADPGSGSAGPAAASTSSEPPPVGPRWWTPGPRFGLTMDFVQRLDGVPELYNQIAALMVTEGYLPRQAVGDGTRTPWDTLQGLSVTGADVNQPGQAYLNWRLLVSQLSEESLRARADDVLSADAGQPGVTWVFSHPADPVSPNRGLTIGLWAEATGVDTYQRATDYQVQYGHTSVDTMAVKGASSRISDLSGYAGAGGTGRSDGLGQGQVGGQLTRSATDKLGRTQSTALTSDTDGQKMPSSEFEVGIRWRWFANHGQASLEQPAQIPATAILLQPNALHADASQSALAPLDVVAARPDSSLDPISTREDPPPGLLDDRRMRSVLTTMTAAIYTTIGVQGVGVLQERLIRMTGLPATAVWQGLTPTVYKTVLIRGLAASATIPIGDQLVDLTVRPVGRPEVVKDWLPYTQQVLESQVGHEQGNDSLRQHGWQAQGTGGATALGPDDAEFLTGSGAVTRSTGTGESAASLRTVGSYRGVYQDTRMAIVRTVVVNRVQTAGGALVETFGEVWLNVLRTDVLANRDAFDNVKLLDDPVSKTKNKADKPVSAPKTEAVAPPPPMARSLSTEKLPPVSLQDGLSWAVMWPMLFNGGGAEAGFGGLSERLAAEAARFGEPELVTQVRSLPSWLSPYLAKMRDGGAAWTFQAGGRVFEVLMSAELVGPARDSRPGGNGVKVYERGNAYRDATRRNVASTGVTGGLTGGGQPGGLDGHWGLTVTGGRTGRVEQADTRGSNLLFMAGLRANKLMDFTQAVRFHATIREITSLGTRVVDATVGRLRERPHRSSTIRVDEDHVVSVPDEGTVARGEPVPDLRTRLGRVLPPTSLVEGILGLRVIHEAVKSTRVGGVSDPATVPPATDQLTFETMRGSLAAMLTEQGAWFRSVATAGEVVDPGPAGFRVRARFGEVRQLYYMAKAELENYDHGTDLVAHNRSQNNRENLTGTFTLGVEVAPGNSVGPQVSFGAERSRAVGTDQTAWIEHRAWLRADTSVYFVYAMLEYEIGLPGTGLAPMRRAGSVELVVDEKSATELGIPIDTLRSVVPVKTPVTKLPGAAAPSPSAPAGPSAHSDPTSSDYHRQLSEMFHVVVERLRAVPESGSSGPRPRDASAPAADPPSAVPAASTPPVPPEPVPAAPNEAAVREADRFRAAFRGPDDGPSGVGSSSVGNSSSRKGKERAEPRSTW
ncbi:WXG100-like domain-containing protein [Micromonospora rubida]